MIGANNDLFGRSSTDTTPTWHHLPAPKRKWSTTVLAGGVKPAVLVESKFVSPQLFRLVTLQLTFPSAISLDRRATIVFDVNKHARVMLMSLMVRTDRKMISSFDVWRDKRARARKGRGKLPPDPAVLQVKFLQRLSPRHPTQQQRLPHPAKDRFNGSFIPQELRHQMHHHRHHQVLMTQTQRRTPVIPQTSLQILTDW